MKFKNWRIGGRNGNTRTEVVQEAQPGLDKLVAVVTTHEFNYARPGAVVECKLTTEGRENLLLIAAAPDLYKACEMTEDYPEINFANYSEDEVRAVQNWAFAVIDAARAAMKKAKGE